MNFSAQSVWEMTKLFVSDPGEASRRILVAGLPLNVSVLMIVLAGVASGVLAAILQAILGPQSIVLELADGTRQSFQQASPMVTGVLSSLLGLAFAYLVHWVGQRLGGSGSLPQVMSVIAALQIALTVLTFAAVFADLALPLVGLLLSILVIYVSIRGLGHAVKEGHQLPTMGASIGVILGAIVLLFMCLFVLMFFVVLLGLGPTGVVQ